jgi:integrase
VCRENVPASQHPADRYAVFLRIERGTKGGRLRFVAIRNRERHSALERALPFAPHPSSHLGHPGLTLKQSLKRFDNVMRKAGVTKKELGVTAHGLRHQFAQEAPASGGDECADPAILNAALLEIARQLGHNRTAITRTYLKIA